MRRVGEAMQQNIRLPLSQQRISSIQHGDAQLGQLPHATKGLGHAPLLQMLNLRPLCHTSLAGMAAAAPGPPRSHVLLALLLHGRQLRQPLHDLH